jgi:hypothetical protein
MRNATALDQKKPRPFARFGWFVGDLCVGKLEIEKAHQENLQRVDAIKKDSERRIAQIQQEEQENVKRIHSQAKRETRRVKEAEAT